MQTRSHRARGGFTLLELLVVISIIAILGSITCVGLRVVWIKAHRAKAASQIRSLQTALASYYSDTKCYPRRATPVTAANLWRNDAAWLYAALDYGSTVELGGGPSRYHLDFHAEDLAFVKFPEPPEVAPFTLSDLGEDRYRLDEVEFQRAHAPSRSPETCVVFLDPWGNPFHYREWASVPEPLKASAKRTMTVKNEDGTTTTVIDRPRVTSAFEVWSYGQNGINEWGQGDDITNSGP